MSAAAPQPDRFDSAGLFGGFTTPSPSGSAPANGSGPPIVWLAVAALASLISLGLAAPTLKGVTFYVVGWALAGPIAIGLLTIFARVDTARQTAMYYSYPSWKGAAYRIALGLAFVAVICAALRIAEWAGHR